MEFIALVLALIAVIWARKANIRSHEVNARLTQLEASLAGGARPVTRPVDAPIAPPIVPETATPETAERTPSTPPPLPPAGSRYRETVDGDIPDTPLNLLHRLAPDSRNASAPAGWCGSAD